MTNARFFFVFGGMGARTEGTEAVVTLEAKQARSYRTRISPDDQSQLNRLLPRSAITLLGSPSRSDGSATGQVWGRKGGWGKSTFHWTGRSERGSKSVLQFPCASVKVVVKLIKIIYLNPLTGLRWNTTGPLPLLM
jgi:hypothetical protein